MNLIGIFLSIILLSVGIIFSVIVSNKDTTAKDKLNTLSTYAYVYLGIGIFALFLILFLLHQNFIEKTTFFYYLSIPIVFLTVSIYLLVLKNSNLDDNALLCELFKISIGTITVGAFIFGLTAGCKVINFFKRDKGSKKEAHKENAYANVKD